MIDERYASLSPALVRRGTLRSMDFVTVSSPAAPSINQDLRLFLITWAAGFAFLMAFLA